MSLYETSSLPPDSALPQIPWILNLDPGHDRRCVGYDGETGFRCNHKISSQSRKSAKRLLSKMTFDLYGNYLDGLDDSLSVLAGLLLCDKRHQNHAPLLIARWQREIREFWDEGWGGVSRRDAYAMLITGDWLVYGPDGIGREHTDVLNSNRLHGHGSDARRKPRLHRLYESFKERIHNPLYTLSDIAYALCCHGKPEDPEISYFSPIHDDWMFPNNYDLGYEHDYPSPPRPLCCDDDVQRQSINAESECCICLNLLIENPPYSDHEPSMFRRSTNPDTDGDFHLFLQPPFDTIYPAYGTGLGTYDSEGGNYTTGSIYDTNYLNFHVNGREEQIIEGQTSLKDSNNREPELTWCRMSCGTNYHKKCIGDWLATSAFGNCPTCRSCWARDPCETYGGWGFDDER